MLNLKKALAYGASIVVSGCIASAKDIKVEKSTKNKKCSISMKIEHVENLNEQDLVEMLKEVAESLKKYGKQNLLETIKSLLAKEEKDESQDNKSEEDSKENTEEKKESAESHEKDGDKDDKSSSDAEKEADESKKEETKDEDEKKGTLKTLQALAAQLHLEHIDLAKLLSLLDGLVEA